MTAGLHGCFSLLCIPKGAAGRAGQVAASLEKCHKGKRAPHCPQGHLEYCPPPCLSTRTRRPRDMKRFAQSLPLRQKQNSQDLWYNALRYARHPVVGSDPISMAEETPVTKSQRGQALGAKGYSDMGIWLSKVWKHYKVQTLLSPSCYFYMEEESTQSTLKGLLNNSTQLNQRGRECRHANIVSV